MRVLLAGPAIVICATILSSGCSSPATSSVWQKFSLKKSQPAASSSVAASTKDTNSSTAGGTSSFNNGPVAAPAVSMSAATPAQNSMPVYPGTSYPVTPYPATPAPASVAATPSYAAGVPDNSMAHGQQVPPATSGYGGYGVAAQPNPYAPQQPVVNNYTPPGGYSAAVPSDSTTR